MTKEVTIINKEELEQVGTALNNKYGDRGKGWDCAVIPMGNGYAVFAVTPPNRAVYRGMQSAILRAEKSGKASEYLSVVEDTVNKCLVDSARKAEELAIVSDRYPTVYDNLFSKLLKLQEAGVADDFEFEFEKKSSL